MTHIYQEEGGKFRVKVLSDTTEAGMRKAQLECIETLQPTTMALTIPAGEHFEVTCATGCEALVGWTLVEDD